MLISTMFPHTTTDRSSYPETVLHADATPRPHFWPIDSELDDLAHFDQHPLYDQHAGGEGEIANLPTIAPADGIERESVPIG